MKMMFSDMPDSALVAIEMFLTAKSLKCRTLRDYQVFMKHKGLSIDHWPEFTRIIDPGLQLSEQQQALIILSEINNSRK